MLNNSSSIEKKLSSLNLSNEEAKLYIELLRSPNSHQKLAHATGINRTKVYRLAAELEKRSLISRRTDDRGTFLVAADPATLEVELVSQEEKLKEQRAALTQLLPDLEKIKSGEGSSFIVHTYEGVEGFKQMLWHELKAQKELLTLGKGKIDDLVANRNWAEKHRAMTIEAGYHIRQIHNYEDGTNYPFTLHQDFLARYSYRLMDSSILLLKQQTVIYNDTVAIYHWRNEEKVGLEITNHAYAAMMRHVFEQYWSLAQPPEATV